MYEKNVNTEMGSSLKKLKQLFLNVMRQPPVSVLALTYYKRQSKNSEIMAFEPNRTNPSICVPRVFPNITWKRVKEVFEELGLGEVERVDMVNKTNDKGEKFKRVFGTSSVGTRTRQQVREGKAVVW